MKDTKVWFEDEKGNRFAIIKTEKIDMQKELTEQISRLLEENKALREEIEYLKNKCEMEKERRKDLEDEFIWGNKDE